MSSSTESDYDDTSSNTSSSSNDSDNDSSWEEIAHSTPPPAHSMHHRILTSPNAATLSSAYKLTMSFRFKYSECMIHDRPFPPPKGLPYEVWQRILSYLYKETEWAAEIKQKRVTDRVDLYGWDGREVYKLVERMYSTWFTKRVRQLRDRIRQALMFCDLSGLARNLPRWPKDLPFFLQDANTAFLFSHQSLNGEVLRLVAHPTLGWSLRYVKKANYITHIKSFEGNDDYSDAVQFGKPGSQRPGLDEIDKFIPKYHAQRVIKCLDLLIQQGFCDPSMEPLPLYCLNGLQPPAPQEIPQEIISHMLTAWPSINLNQGSYTTGITVLHRAIEIGHSALVNLLLGLGADPEAVQYRARCDRFPAIPLKSDSDEDEYDKRRRKENEAMRYDEGMTCVDMAVWRLHYEPGEAANEIAELFRARGFEVV